MSATAAKYRAPFCTQRGIDSTLDDCSVVATLHGLAYATLGEYVTTAQGREMGKAQLHSRARGMRRSIAKVDDGGGLSLVERQLMCTKAGFPAPRSVDRTFADFKADLKSRRVVYSVGGNPAQINGPSPLKRTNVPHEWLVAWDPVCGADKLLIYDGMRPAGSTQRGEVRPASEVRQMAFKDSDGELNTLLAYPIGDWTAEGLQRSEVILPLRKQNAALEARVTGLISDKRALAKEVRDLREQVGDSDCTEAQKAAREQLLDSLGDWLAEQRTT
jgi:hypothetical protein